MHRLRSDERKMGALNPSLIHTVNVNIFLGQWHLFWNFGLLPILLDYPGGVGLSQAGAIIAIFSLGPSNNRKRQSLHIIIGAP
ncbi:hypothetical protein EDB19DRAFT_886677 [Suillus lakei]|nr:hypothetical protein EDB19DRAFT_886677 [Suillus lakei]